MAKKFFYDDDARRRVLGGAEALYNAVKVPMGALVVDVPEADTPAGSGIPGGMGMM